MSTAFLFPDRSQVGMGVNLFASFQRKGKLMTFWDIASQILCKWSEEAWANWYTQPALYLVSYLHLNDIFGYGKARWPRASVGELQPSHLRVPFPF